MKKSFVIFFSLFSCQVIFAGDFIVAPIANSDPNRPLEICYNDRFHDYYPSRLFDIECINSKYVIYNLHCVYLDSCSTPKLKTIQVKIPKEFKGICCSVSSTEFVYSFQTKKSEILVYIPTTGKDTLSNYERSMKYTYPLSDPKLYSSIYEMPITRQFRENKYLGVKQYCSHAIYYYNFNKKQKEEFEDIQNLDI